MASSPPADAPPTAGSVSVGPATPTPDASPPSRIARAEPEGDARATREAAPRSRVPVERTASGPADSRVVIPAIGVDAPMIELGLNPDDSLEVPAEAGETGWWSGGAFPGERGTAVIAGHVDSTSGPAVFFRLGELDPGDEIQVTARSGRVERFIVERSKQAEKDDFPTREVYEATAGPSLRLITCTGEFAEQTGHYEDNLIVFARAA